MENGWLFEYLYHLEQQDCIKKSGFSVMGFAKYQNRRRGQNCENTRAGPILQWETAWEGTDKEQYR